MKKTMFIVAMLFATQIQAQLRIIRHQDEMTDNVYYFASEGFVIKSEDGKSGFRVSLGVKEKNGNLIEDGLNLKVVNVGGCYENNKLIILFQNGEKSNLLSWNKFNCEGDVYFEINDKTEELLKTQKVTKVRFENGRSYESLTGEVEDQEYFIKLFGLIQENKFEKE
jgi:hypothetical protein